MSNEMRIKFFLFFLFPGCPSSSNLVYSGSFSSPNFPNSYSNGESCSWGITVPSGYRVKVEFHAFELEQGYDFLYIYDGPSDSSPQLGRISGHYPPCFFYSNGGSLWFRFETDSSQTRQGFDATFTAVPSYGKCHSTDKSGCRLHRNYHIRLLQNTHTHTHTCKIKFETDLLSLQIFINIH